MGTDREAFVTKAAQLAEKIRRWQDDDSAGYDQAIGLVCQAEEVLTMLSTTPEATPEPPTPENPPCRMCGHPLSAHRPDHGACEGRDGRLCACPEFEATPEPERPAAHTCIKDDGGTPGRECQACAEERPVARCVWRPRKGGVALYAGCSNHAPHADMRGWHWCPFCGQPLSVEEDTHVR